LVLKKIFKTDNDDNILEEFDDLYPTIIHVEYDSTLTCHSNLKHDGLKKMTNSIKIEDLNYELEQIYNSIKINNGIMKSEQKLHEMCIKYLIGDEKILEIGGNIGKTTLIVAHILNNSNLNNDLNFVTMECNLNTANKLKENKELNNFNFHIEKSALSNKILIQKGPQETIASNTLRKGFEYVNTITYEQLIQKYNINFDTLIIDCNGGFYHILIDIPEILNNIKLIIMKNEYDTLNKKNILMMY